MEIMDKEKKKKDQLWPITFRLNKEEKDKMSKDMKLFKTTNNSAYIRALIKTRGQLKNEELEKLENQFKALDENYKTLLKKLQEIQKKSPAEMKNELEKFIEEHKKSCKELAIEILEFRKFLV